MDTRAADISVAIEKVKEAVEKSLTRCGRSSGEVRIMAVTKTRPLEDALAAYSGGIRLFGENRVQEAVKKYSGQNLPEDFELHMIGQLQSNKTRQIAPLVSCVQSVDRIKTAALLDKWAEEADRNLDIMLEYNTSGEDSKSGFRIGEDLSEALAAVLEMKRIRPAGLMTIGPLGGSEKETRHAFARLRELKISLESQFPGVMLNELSMGMSDDFVEAIMEGSTMIRVGSILFGERNYQ
jgi:PLP dependent protein